MCRLTKKKKMPQKLRGIYLAPINTFHRNRCPVSGVDDIQRRYWARKLTGYGPVQPSNEVLHLCTHRYTPRAASNEVLHSCTHRYTPRAARNEVLHSCTHRYKPRAARNEVLHSYTHRYTPRAARKEVLHSKEVLYSCTLDFLSRASMIYSVDTARAN